MEVWAIGFTHCVLWVGQRLVVEIKRGKMACSRHNKGWSCPRCNIWSPYVPLLFYTRVIGRIRVLQGGGRVLRERRLERELMAKELRRRSGLTF